MERFHRILQIAEVPEGVGPTSVADELGQILVERAGDLGRASQVLVLLLPQPRQRVPDVDAQTTPV